MCVAMPRTRGRLTENAQNASQQLRKVSRAINLTFYHSPTTVELGDGHKIQLSNAIQKHLHTIFNKASGYKQSMTREQFEIFLEHTQGVVSPKLEHETYKFEQWLKVLWLHYGTDAIKPSPLEEKDLSQPLSNYFINSSHNTYLWGNQLFSKGTTQAYKHVLKNGCRCIEIDIWNGDEDDPTIPQDEKSRPIGHHRGLSGSSVHSGVATFKDTVVRKIEREKERLGIPKQHSHSPRCSQFGFDTLKPAYAGPAPDTDRQSVKSTFPRHEPIVMHGLQVLNKRQLQLTDPVGFREVCKTIRDFAFETSDLPLIVSLEVHTRHEQQEVMVQIMKEEWEDLLVDAPLDGLPTHQMPKLQDLRRKILVKVKKSGLPDDGTNTSLSVPLGSPAFSDEVSLSDSERSIATTVEQPKVKICNALGALGIYTHSERFEKFDSPSSKTASHIYSLEESKIEELHAHKHKEMFAHNREFFMRAYPKGTRVDSSNLDPTSCWRKGIQMVAMNWSKLDEGMMLNAGMFIEENGWVLKPVGYRGYQDEDPSISQSDAISPKTLDLCITVLAGQNIPLPDGYKPGTKPNDTKWFRPFVKCELHVEKPEERVGDRSHLEGEAWESEYKRKIKHGITDHPEFKNKNALEFITIPHVVDEFSFVRFKVEHQRLGSDILTSWACIRLSRLQSGYRFITLLDKFGRQTDGKLFIKVHKSLH